MVHPGRRHIHPDPLARKFPFTQHPFDRLADTFSRSRSGPTLTNNFAGRMRMYWKNDRMPPGFSSFAYACRMSCTSSDEKLLSGSPEMTRSNCPSLLSGPSCCDRSFDEMAAARGLAKRRLVVERAAQVRGKRRVQLDHPQLVVLPHPIDDAARDGARARPCFENLLRPPPCPTWRQSAVPSARPLGNDRAGRLVVTKKLCEEGLVIGQPIHDSFSVVADHQRPDARHVDFFDRRRAQSRLREERRQIEIRLEAEVHASAARSPARASTRSRCR